MNCSFSRPIHSYHSKGAVLQNKLRAFNPMTQTFQPSYVKLITKKLMPMTTAAVCNALLVLKLNIHANQFSYQSSFLLTALELCHGGTWRGCCWISGSSWIILPSLVLMTLNSKGLLRACNFYGLGIALLFTFTFLNMFILAYYTVYHDSCIMMWESSMLQLSRSRRTECVRGWVKVMSQQNGTVILSPQNVIAECLDSVGVTAWIIVYKLLPLSHC